MEEFLGSSDLTDILAEADAVENEENNVDMKKKLESKNKLENFCFELKNVLNDKET